MGLEVVDWIYLAHDGPVAGSFQHGNETFGSIKGGEFLDQLIILLPSQDGLFSMELVYDCQIDVNGEVLFVRLNGDKFVIAKSNSKKTKPRTSAEGEIELLAKVAA
jgi:hypothetical protein